MVSPASRLRTSKPDLPYRTAVTLKQPSLAADTRPMKRGESFATDALTRVVIVGLTAGVAIQRWRRERARRVLAKS